MCVNCLLHRSSLIWRDSHRVRAYLFPMNTPAIFSAVLLSLIGLAQNAAADWPQYRGPSASGIDASRALPTSWNVETGENVRWHTPIPGLAHSSPIVAADRVYVATAVSPKEAELKVGLYGDIDSANDGEAQEWRLLALDKATGRILWNALAVKVVPKVKRHTKASHCNSTPATDGRHIVAIFGSEGLFCFDTDGKLIWKKDLGPMDSGYFKSPTAQWGFASSPIIHDRKVIVLCDVQKGSFIAEYDIADGHELWRTPRTDVPTWGTPALVQTTTRTQIVANGWHETAGYDFATGAKLWTLDGGGDIPVPTPIFAHGFIYLTSAHGNWRPIRAIHPQATGNITPDDPGKTNASIAWAHGRQGNYMQTPLVVSDLLFACNDMGILTASMPRPARFILASDFPSGARASRHRPCRMESICISRASWGMFSSSQRSRSLASRGFSNCPRRACPRPPSVTECCSFARGISSSPSEKADVPKA